MVADLETDHQAEGAARAMEWLRPLLLLLFLTGCVIAAIAALHIVIVTMIAGCGRPPFGNMGLYAALSDVRMHALMWQAVLLIAVWALFAVWTGCVTESLRKRGRTDMSGESAALYLVAPVTAPIAPPFILRKIWISALGDANDRAPLVWIWWGSMAASLGLGGWSIANGAARTNIAALSAPAMLNLRSDLAVHLCAGISVCAFAVLTDHLGRSISDRL